MGERWNVTDMHCDTISALLGLKRKGEVYSLRKNNLHLDLERMYEGGYLLQNFALFVNCRKCTSPWEEFCELFRVYEEQLKENQDLIQPVLRYEDIEKNRLSGKMSALLTVEEGEVCEGEIEKLEILYQRGVRMLTLTWNCENKLGYPNVRPGMFLEPDTEKGLTKTGIAFVERMEELGMIVDVSHLSDAGFYDVCANTKKPFVASHSNAREICGFVRNLTDPMIRELANRGGCMGLNFCVDFLVGDPSDPNDNNSLDWAVRHAKYIVNVGGIEVLGLGSDFDGIDTNPHLPGAQSMECLWEALHKAGFTQGQLEQIFSRNVLRVYREIM